MFKIVNSLKSMKKINKTIIVTLPDSSILSGDPMHDAIDTLEPSFQCEWCPLGLGTLGPPEDGLRLGHRKPSSFHLSPGVLDSEEKRDAIFPSSRKPHYVYHAVKNYRK